MSSVYKQYIGGAWVDASHGGTWDVIDPATELAIVTVPFGDGTDCRLALDSAEQALPAWSRATAYTRASYLRNAADRIRSRVERLAEVTVGESGKPLAQAKGEWQVAADLFEWFGEEAKRAYGRVIPSRVASKRMMVLKQPIGVVGVITAWNFPAYNPVRAWAAALAAGCTVVARPSEYTPLTAMELANVLHEVELPAGVLNLVNGEPGPMGQALLESPICRKISFTGSVRVGRILMDGASRTFKRLSLELGGNAPVLIFPDADLDLVARSAVSAKFRNAGQVCISPQRFFVHASCAEEFSERVVPQVKNLRIGHGLSPETDVGPLINQAQRERVEAMVVDARSRGVSVLAGGSRPGGIEQGFFFEPTVLSGVQPDLPIFSEEIFGPVLPIASFDDVDEAIAAANRTDYGLAAYVWTRDIHTAIRCYEGLEFGMIGVNEWAPQATEAPFPGWKSSGLGSESGQEGLEEYLETKLVAFGGLPKA
ncbi:MAG TPA: NAD-dependent succinate-semialdehyde dehydrogenase [Vicinamibacteria bacterium]|nr:NAD-dependent succinate-semialdehyde dehydrogenase [Vicinamibacteria bacterium]